MPSLVTPNGLEKINLGAGVGDFSADSIVDVCLKANTNVDILDEALTTLAALEADMTSLRDKGFVAGFVNGGVCVAPEP